MSSVLAFRLSRKDVDAERTDALRRRALERLCSRKAAIHELIRALERYQEAEWESAAGVTPIYPRNANPPTPRRRRNSLERA